MLWAHPSRYTLLQRPNTIYTNRPSASPPNSPIPTAAPSTRTHVSSLCTWAPLSSHHARPRDNFFPNKRAPRFLTLTVEKNIPEQRGSSPGLQNLASSLVCPPLFTNEPLRLRNPSFPPNTTRCTHDRKGPALHTQSRRPGTPDPPWPRHLPIHFRPWISAARGEKKKPTLVPK